MNQKNHEGRRSARERLQAQRAKEQARARRSRQVIVAGSLLAALAMAGGVAVWVTAAGNGESGTDNETARPKQAGGGDRPAVPVGAPDAPSTLTVWEDFRCPACQQFETGFRKVTHELEDSGQLKSEYHLVTIIDGNMGGQGSLNAANAALCAQDAGKFRDFHDVLYSHQPPESQDKFADKQYLLRLAGKVKGLASPAFTKCVNDGTYNGFVRKSDGAFGKSGYRGTPTVLLNGKDLAKEQSGRVTPAVLKKLVRAANKGKKPGSVSPSASTPAAPGRGAAAGASASPHAKRAGAASASPRTGAVPSP
ncbi:thioredoxin domain-containing protein [Streptomyces sirii]|uniref:DsbA family protein n=1 Tax=Streptomyces sirii TaxID=3127701 RepID=UPI003D364DAF